MLPGMLISNYKTFAVISRLILLYIGMICTEIQVPCFYISVDSRSDMWCRFFSPYFLSVLLFLSVGDVSGASASTFSLDVNLSYDNANSVPVIMYSHKLSPGLLKYSKEYDYRQILPAESFVTIAEDLLDQCNSNAYIFINVPGLNEYDFHIYRDRFVYLQKYIQYSSTALKFEKVSTFDQDTVGKLIDRVKTNCNVDKKVIKLKGNSTEGYEAYIDSDTRIFVIDYPNLPKDKELRGDAIGYFDKYFREIVAQLPSPDQTIIYTGINSNILEDKDEEEDIDSYTYENDEDEGFDQDDEQDGYGSAMTKPPMYAGIFPDLFNAKKDEEKNNMLVDVPVFRNKPRPILEGISTKYISIFENEFFNENLELIKIIATSTLCYIVYQIFSVIYSDKTPVEKGTKSNIKQMSTEKVLSVDEKVKQKKAIGIEKGRAQEEEKIE